jgi:hypothetical protein
VLLETNRNISGLSFGNTTSEVKGSLVSTPGSDPGDALEVFESLAARSKFTGRYESPFGCSVSQKLSKQFKQL